MKLRLTRRAETDLESIAAYLYARNPQGAARVTRALQEAFALLATYSRAGRALRGGVRRLAVPRHPYLIFYRLDEATDELRVLTIRHAARREEI